jgi:lipopolysaccharide transport system ATP-binding protein
MDSEDNTVVRVTGLSKKFCRSLRRSLWYGVADAASEFRFSRGGLRSAHAAERGLRPQEFWAVRDVSFELQRGECIGLIGHNGAGKTTLLRMLNGLIKPDAGEAVIRGRVGALISLGAGFNPILTGRENVYVNASVLGLSRSEIDARIDEIIDFAELREFIDSPVQGYSSGMAVRLGFAVATAVCPDVLLLDEVLAVGDMAFYAKCFRRLSEIRLMRSAFILVGHNMHQIARICDRVMVLDHGAVVYSGPTEKGIEHYHRIQAEKMDQVPELQTAGTRTQWFSGVCLADQQGNTVTALGPGDGFVVRWKVQPGLPSGKWSVDLVIRDAADEALVQVSQDLEFHEESHGGGHLTAVVPSLPLSPGRYRLSLAVWALPSRELIFWQKGISLPVVGDSSTVGILAVKAEVRMEPGNPVSDAVAGS